ncbi:MAG: transglutaminase domain-containing protein [Marinoscillum sp.]
MRILTFLLLVISLQAGSQSFTLLVNPKYEKAPWPIANSPIKLAQYLTENDTSEFQKAVNIYTWMVNNIKYDVGALGKIKSKTYSPKQTLRRRKGICYQYSALFASLCQNAGISSREITGYSRGFSYHEDDRFFEANHSWNGVKIDSAWYLLDVTWGSGRLQQKRRWFKEWRFRWFKKPYINDKYKFITQPDYHYFMVKPQFLIRDHLPVDPNWQLLKFPISVNTFESSKWQSYVAEMDSIYQKQVDSSVYVHNLNKYEYSSGLQYLQKTAEQSNIFNSRNYRLEGISSYSNAKSYENASGDLEERLEAYNRAAQSYKEAINQLKRHQRSAISESSKVIKISEDRINRELTRPLNERINRNNREHKVADSFLDKLPRLIDSHKGNIIRLQKSISRKYRSFEKPAPTRRERPELVEKNRSEIEESITDLNHHQDSVVALVKSVQLCMEARRPIQKEIVNQYQKLPSLFDTNIYFITQNFGLTQVSQSMHAADSIGQIIDSLNVEKMVMDRRIRQDRSAIKQLRSSMRVASTQMQKMIIQNCQLSGNTICDESLYNSLNSGFLLMYESQLQLENQYLQSTKYDGKICKDLKAITIQVREASMMDARFISEFQRRRLGGINFKLKKSLYETDQLIRDCQKGLRRLKRDIPKLRNEIVKAKNK